MRTFLVGMLDTLLPWALALTLGAAVITDLRRRTIPNVLSMGGLVAALLIRGMLGWPDLLSGLGAAVLAFAFALPFFAAGGLGGGDVKLMAAAAAFLGVERLIPGLLVMAVTGVVMALVAVARRGAVLSTLANVHVILLTVGRKTFTGWRGQESATAHHLAREGAVTIPYAVAIAAGGLGGWFLG